MNSKYLGVKGNNGTSTGEEEQLAHETILLLITQAPSIITENNALERIQDLKKLNFAKNFSILLSHPPPS